MPNSGNEISDASEILNNLDADTPTIDLKNIANEVKNELIQRALIQVAPTAAQSLTIHDDSMSEDDAKHLLDFLKAPEQATITLQINLPAHLQNTKVQIELDNLISNHQLEKNIQALSDNLPKETTIPIKKKAIGRTLPEGKIKPKIEITLHQEIISDEPSGPAVIGEDPSINTAIAAPISLERHPLPEKILIELLAQPGNETKKHHWEEISTRKEALEFREKYLSLSTTDTADHPLNRLLNTEQREQLEKWNTTLKLGKDQYDAIYDVYAQYGTQGINGFFASWNELMGDDLKQSALIEMHQSLLHKLPSYIPFVQNKNWSEIIAKTSRLGPERRGLWMALLKAHSEQNGTLDLVYLHTTFTEAELIFDSMGLTEGKMPPPKNNEFSQLKNKKDLPGTLADMIALLRKCPVQDLNTQGQYINKIDFSQQTEGHFNIPEMDLANTHPDLEEIKHLIKNAPDSDPELIKPAFYRYLAEKNNHLPLSEYKKILDEIFSNTELNNQVKLSMAYVLAITTSTDNQGSFDSKRVLSEWRVFQERTIEIPYMKRIYKNNSTVQTVIERARNNNQIRFEVLDLMMEMKTIPPINFFNKLLTLSECKFLDLPNNFMSALAKLPSLKEEMNGRLNKASDLYFNMKKINPKAMNEAIRLIKTDVIITIKKGEEVVKYTSHPEDQVLLENFNMACELLTEVKYNKLQPPNDHQNPQNLLLPLLTVFNLEYATEAELKELISRYLERINPSNQQPEFKEKIAELFPYALTLLQLIQNRDTPIKLTCNTLNTIQDELITFICQPNLVTKKSLREWLHANYGEHFADNALLDIKDEVNCSTIFEELNFTDIELRKSIEKVISNFDNDDEVDSQPKLVKALVNLAITLPNEQTNEFLEFCNEAFKTNGILSRKNQYLSPELIQECPFLKETSFIGQYIALVTTITEIGQTTQFSQYMNLVQEHVLNKGSGQHSIAKCMYHLNILYPFLVKKKIERKEAFNFGGQLVCQSPLEVLNKSHDIKKSSSEELISIQKLQELQTEITHFNQFDRSPNELGTLRQKVEAISTAGSDNPNYFKELRALISTIDDITSAINKRTEDHNKLSRWARFKKWTTNIGGYEPAITQDEFTTLQIELGNITQNLHKEIALFNRQMTTRFQYVVTHLHEKKSALISKYGNLSIRINDFIDNALSLSPENVTKNHNDTCQLIDDLIALDDQNSVLSLMYHYAGGMTDRGVKDLVELFNAEEYKALNPTLRKEFINVIMTQMNNNVRCNKADINKFLTFVHANKDKEVIMSCMHDYYQHAPYPSLSKFMLWTKNLDTRAAIDKAYAIFDKNPCGFTQGHDGREKENGFHIKHAKKILEKMPEVKEIFSESYLLEIASAEKLARNLSTKEILEQLKNYKNDTTHKNHINLVMLAAELLHRCKGRPPEFVGTKQISGRSFELNTTQIISILSLLEKGKKVTAEIGTGEGKSRILMIVNACQYLKGLTVDCLTIGALAERDYLASLPFFTSLGAQTSLITASSSFDDYKIGGINFSDPASLCLLRNKAISENQEHKVIDPDPENRALTLDEADVTYFDVSTTQYNFSSKTPKANKDLLPIYPLLMEFFAQKETENTYRVNKQRCNEQLLDFIEKRDPKLFKIVKKISLKRLEKLQDDAYIARHLEYNVDYAIVTSATAPTALGEKKVAAARCLIGSQIEENARFKGSIHACLHAELNRLMKSSSTDQISPPLMEMLEKCKEKQRSYTSEPERKISYTSTSNTMLRSYEKGSIMAVTGTIGTNLEKEEAQTHFGTQFVHVPRHKGLHRYDRPVLIFEREEAYLDACVNSILEAQAKKQPLLIICKDDNQSLVLQKTLERRIESKRDKNGLPKITRIHAASNSEDKFIHAATNLEDKFNEESYINEFAGKPGYVTISTGMEGRGVDIIPATGSGGLKVQLNYLPKNERDYLQIIGRSGRAGQIGTSQMILSLDMLKEDFGINSLNSDFYLNPEAYIRRIQIFETIKEELRRLFNKAFDDHSDLYTACYKTLNTSNSEELKEAWSNFLEQQRLNQESTQQSIEAQLQRENPDIHLIKKLLDDNGERTHQLWQEFIESEGLSSEQKKSAQLIAKPLMKKPVLLEEWFKDMEQSEGKTTVDVEEIRRVNVYDHYDPGTIGRLNIVKHPSAFLPNFRAWLKGEGELFPNIKAWWAGDLTFRDFFAVFANISAHLRGEGLLFPNFQAWWTGNLSFRNMVSQWPFFRIFIHPKQEERKATIKVPSTYSTFYKAHPELMKQEKDPSSEEDDLELPKEPKNKSPLDEQSEVVEEHLSNVKTP